MGLLGRLPRQRGRVDHDPDPLVLPPERRLRVRVGRRVGALIAVLDRRGRLRPGGLSEQDRLLPVGL